MRVKTLVKVVFSEGEGVQLDVLLKGGGGVMKAIAEKILC